jgi:hypothetical protein
MGAHPLRDFSSPFRHHLTAGLGCSGSPATCANTRLTMSACLARPYAESAVPPPRPHLASQPALPKPVAGGQVSSGRQKRSHNGRRRDDDTDRALPDVYVGRRQPAIPLQGECHDDPGGEPGGEGGHSRIWPTAAYPVLGGGESLRNAFSKSGSGPRSKREVPHRAIGGGTSLQKRACCWGGRPLRSTSVMPRQRSLKTHPFE